MKAIIAAVVASLLLAAAATAMPAADAQDLAGLDTDIPVSPVVLAEPSDEGPPMSLMPLIAQGCCKFCSTGKACGDSCIARNKACRKGRGCACD